MAKRSSAYTWALPPRPAGMPAYRWLYESLRAEILAGRLRPGSRVPATRDLADQYALARGTIVTAFEQLQAEGYLQGTVGSGTHVSEVLPEELLHVRADGGKSGEQQRRRRRYSAFARRLKAFSPLEIRASRAFRPNVPALDLFPTTLWAQIAARRLRRVPVSLLLGCDPLGYRPLRQAIADYLTTSRGVTCDAEQIAVVSGAQEALDLVARLFLDPGDRVCMEDPGYIGAAILFEAVGARIATAGVDDEGMQLRASTLRNARLVYVTPAHQFPLSITMSLARRLQLLEWARKANALIFEDDYDSEYRYSGRPLPALQGLDPHGVVIFSGSFSKVLFPSLRLGYLVVPRDLVPKFAAAMSSTMRHTTLLDQAVLCDFIVDGHFGRHLRRMRQIYAERLAVLLEEGRQRLAGLLEISDVQAGLQTSAWLAPDIDEEAAVAAAAARNVEVTPLREYSRRRMKRQGLQLGFAAIDEREIRRGVRELEIALS